MCTSVVATLSQQQHLCTVLGSPSIVCKHSCLDVVCYLDVHKQSTNMVILALVELDLCISLLNGGLCLAVQ